MSPTSTPASRPGSTWTRRVAGGFAVGAIWLFLAAVPVMADGGPHVISANSGTSTLTTDSCAGCHRAHTATGPMLLNAPTEEDLCLGCHGTAGQGATTNVEDGVQYSLADGSKNVIGALRSGGFVNARIDADAPARIFRTGSALNVFAKVSVGPSDAVTSAHLNLDGNGLTAPTVAWGNGDDNTGAGPVVDMTCTSCHNPHGNNKYRILNPIPAPESETTDPFDAVAAPGVSVTDAALPAPGDTRNYTVIQTLGTIGQPSTFLLYASQLTPYPNTAGDYWHTRVPWNSTTFMSDAPNGLPSGSGSFNTQIEDWCLACHSRYYGTTSTIDEPQPDALFKYKHPTDGRATCTTCHVAHGSNAPMDGDGFTSFSSIAEYPDGTPSGSSRLLKVSNRGTCQLCHDPTDTVSAGTYTGPVPAPGVP